MGCEMKDYKRLTTKCEVGIGLTETSGNIVNDYEKVVNRLAELEDKIESRELVEVPKGAVVLTPEERKQAVREFLKLLKEKESPKLLMWEYGEGYLDCIKTAEKLAAQYGVEVEE